MQIREVFALNLRKYRHAARLSQEELAHRAEIDRTYISSLERGIYGASIDVVAKLAEVLDIEAADLLRKPMRSVRSRKASGMKAPPED
jgi:transcriptional regulator with XRE-family HTH domain